MSHRILVLDNEPDWIATYRDWLEPEGYEVRGANTMAGALAEAESWRPHVALIDKNLEGGAGRELGLALIQRLAGSAPATQSILVTAFATRESVERAFASGATDYLEKTPILPALLRLKLPGLCKVAARSLDDAPAREAELKTTWAAAQTEPHPQRKGRLLETTVRLLFESIPGFTHARTNAANETEELDLLVMNRSTDPLLARQGDFVVVECKNWSSVVGTPVSSRLVEKVRKRYGRSKLGIVVSVGGFAESVRTDLLANRYTDVLVLLVDRDALSEWIAAPQRDQWLVQRIQAAVVGG